jgi:hypothetical protein
MRDVIEEDKRGRTMLPRVMTHREKFAAECRRRAGMVDASGALDRHAEALRIQKQADARRESLASYEPSYPWTSY